MHQPGQREAHYQSNGRVLFEHELTRLRTCLNHQTPFGSADWLVQFTGAADLDRALRPRDNPANFQRSSLSLFAIREI